MGLDFNKFAKDANEFIHVLAKELEMPEDTEKAGRIMRAVFHVFRNMIAPEESLQLISSIPMFLKAVYVEGWKIKKHKRIKHVNELMIELRLINYPTGVSDFPDKEATERNIAAVFNALRRYVSESELNDIKLSLPEDLKHLIKPLQMVL